MKAGLIALALAAATPVFAAPDPQAALSRLEERIQAATGARRWDEAIALGREALAIEEKTKGADHPEVGGTLSLIVGSSRVDLQACKLEYSIVSPK